MKGFLDTLTIPFLYTQNGYQKHNLFESNAPITLWYEKAFESLILGFKILWLFWPWECLHSKNDLWAARDVLNLSRPPSRLARNNPNWNGFL